jgi:hypothetical protein
MCVPAIIERVAPLFHLLGLPRGFVESRLEVGPPCAHATLMADFVLSARTINFDGRRLTMYTLATTGHKIAGNPGENKRGDRGFIPFTGPSYQEIRS